MSTSCQIVSVAPVLLALTEANLPRTELSSKILGLFDIVYAWSRTADVRQLGHNYAIYDGATPHRLRVRVGFPVSGPFADTDLVKCVELAAGRAAQATHVGPYGDLHVTYARLADWCSRAALPMSGESWEIYGDWHDDPTKLVTEVHLRLCE